MKMKSEWDCIREECEQTSQEEGNKILTLELKALWAEVERLRITDRELHSILRSADCLCGDLKMDLDGYKSLGEKLRELAKRLSGPSLINNFP